jgi:hypothetical protein
MGGGTQNLFHPTINEYEPWSQRKDFGLEKNTSTQVRGDVCLDKADVVIDGMTLVDAGAFQRTRPLARR